MVRTDSKAGIPQWITAIAALITALTPIAAFVYRNTDPQLLLGFFSVGALVFWLWIFKNSRGYPVWRVLSAILAVLTVIDLIAVVIGL